MSNSPSTLSDQALSPELSAMDKLGKSFRSVYNLIFYTYLLIFAFFACSYIGYFSHLDQLTNQLPVKIFVIGVVSCFLSYYLFVWLRFYIRVWLTPASIVPGSEIGKIFVISTVLLFIVTVSLMFLKNALDGGVIKLLLFANGLFGLISAICYMIYLYRLADAISSNRIKSCVKWIVSCALAYVVLYVGGMFLVIKGIIASSNGDYIGLAASIIALIGCISYLNSFDYAAKDISKYIEKHNQE